MRVTETELAALSARLEGKGPLDVLRFVHEAFGERAAILSSMQRAGTILCHMADRAGLGFDVLFVDTGVLHPETLETRDELAKRHPRLRVLTLRPEKSMREQVAERGVLYLSQEGQEACCALRKSAPLHALRGRYDVLVSALRASEGGRRGKVKVFGIDAEMNALRVHPFAHLPDEVLDAYVASNDVVLNPLHAMGFPTVGCYPCTTPVLPDEPPRAGRWRHLASVAYCGINPVDRAAGEASVELDARYAPLFAGPRAG